MFDELKKQCLDALQDTGQDDDLTVIELDKVVYTTKGDVKKLYSFLKEMEIKENSEKLKEYVKSKHDDIPYIIDLREWSRLNEFQNWIENITEKNDPKAYITKVDG